MKFHPIVILIAVFPLTSNSNPNPAVKETVVVARQTSYNAVKSYPVDKKLSVIMRNCPMSEFGTLLANLTGREVLISARVLNTTIPDLVIDDYPEKVKDAIISRMKAVEVRIGELYPYTLVCFDCPAPMLDGTFELK